MGTPKKTKEARREQMAEAALELIGEGGLRALSLVGIAQKVGLVPSAVYRHFDNVEQVLDAAILRIRDRLARNVVEARQGTDDPVETLHRMLLLHVETIVENAALPRVIFSEGVFAGHPERKALVWSFVSDYLAVMEALFRRAQDRGRVRPDTPPAVLAGLFLGLVQTPGVLWHLSGGTYDARRHAEEGWRALLESLTGDGAMGRRSPSEACETRG